MRLGTRAREIGRPTGERSWIVTLGALVPHGPALLADVELQTDRAAGFVVRPPRGSPPPTGRWWRELETQVEPLLAKGDPSEIGLYLRVVWRFPWHARKLRVLERLEARATGLPVRLAVAEAHPG